MPENKKLLFLSDTKEALDYIPKRAFSTTNYPKRTNPGQHADFIRRKIQECQTQSGASATTLSPEQVAAIHSKEGMYIEFSSASGYDLAIKSLENITSGIRLLNVKEIDGVTKATVYVPNGKESLFLKKVNDYAESSVLGEKPKNND